MFRHFHWWFLMLFITNAFCHLLRRLRVADIALIILICKFRPAEKVLPPRTKTSRNLNAPQLKHWFLPNLRATSRCLAHWRISEFVYFLGFFDILWFRHSPCRAGLCRYAYYTVTGLLLVPGNNAWVLWFISHWAPDFRHDICHRHTLPLRAISAYIYRAELLPMISRLILAALPPSIFQLMPLSCHLMLCFSLFITFYLIAELRCQPRHAAPLSQRDDADVAASSFQFQTF